MRFDVASFGLVASALLATPVQGDCPNYASWSQQRHAPFSTGAYQLSYQRPEPACRTFNSTAVEDTIVRLQGKIHDPDLFRLFENTFPNTLDTAIKWRGVAANNTDEELCFVITGDINAMWIRDSANQIAPYRSAMKDKTDDMASVFRGVINLQARYLVVSPYCNAFHPPPESGIPVAAAPCPPASSFSLATTPAHSDQHTGRPLPARKRKRDGEGARARESKKERTREREEEQAPTRAPPFSSRRRRHPRPTMPTYEKMEDWLQQSQLLLEARPTTTRITTKYSVNDVQMRKRAARAAKKAAAEAEPAAQPPTTTTTTPRGSLVLKAYDPVSGATLKYRTTKAAEVSRLITSLGGKLGRPMAGLPALRDEPMADAADDAAGTPAAADKADPLSAKAGAPPPPAAGGAKGKKKKGRK